MNQEDLFISIGELHSKILNTSTPPQENEVIFYDDCVEILGDFCVVISCDVYNTLIK